VEGCLFGFGCGGGGGGGEAVLNVHRYFGGNDMPILLFENLKPSVFKNGDNTQVVKNGDNTQVAVWY